MKNKIKTIFFGTGRFAESILEIVLNDDFFEIQQIFTQPDKPQGRGMKIINSPIKEMAIKNDICLLQPQILELSQINDNNIDLSIVADYGKIIPSEIIKLPRFKSINVHPSLLPLYRGSSPIQSVLANGEIVTGLSIMLIDTKMDHGPVLTQVRIPITVDDDYYSLSKKLIDSLSTIFCNSVKKYINGDLKPVNQDHERATFCKVISKNDGMINFKTMSAHEIYNKYRAYIKWPQIYIILSVSNNKLNGKRLILKKIKQNKKKIKAGMIKYINGQLYIGCKKDSLLVSELQLEGKKNSTDIEFINGNQSLNNLIIN